MKPLTKSQYKSTYKHKSHINCSIFIIVVDQHSIFIKSWKKNLINRLSGCNRVHSYIMVHIWSKYMVKGEEVETWADSHTPSR